MSFIYRDRNDEDYLIGTPWMTRFRERAQGRVVYPRYDEVDENGMTKQDRNFENFYASGL